MIAITGASGQLGRLVIQSLLERVPAEQIVALVRDPGKVQDLAARGVVVRTADYNQPATLTAALKGVDKLLLISSNELGNRAAQHRAVIDAAKAAGVTLLAYTSVLHADTSILGLAAEHRDTEAALKASGVPHVLLRNGWYSENYLANVPSAVEHGVLLGSAGEGRISSAPRADYAQAAAVVLTTEGQAGKVYELAGDSSYTLTELAALISQKTGKPVAYQNLPQAEFEAVLISVGLPAGLAALLADSDAAAAKGALFDESGVLGRLIGRGTTPVSESLS
ncbi:MULTISPECIES: SDR family oxidoreductase [Pseudomonas]|uniref:NAD(P)-dependent oxidoreductase n=1 Tax=Pseudomonas fluorescens TaxID=294 RepID=A0A161GSY6_PSEFL|nr:MULTISPECIES: SDR family oxidoreductase [Pseudomonas]AMZ73387.1 NAD(P)-dependent oxidoreductase [Pseudomonas fluorescens]